jgi:hypothetical protein
LIDLASAKTRFKQIIRSRSELMNIAACKEARHFWLAAKLAE